MPAGADYVAEETGTLLLVVQFDPSGLSSEELRERRTAWERERPVLWQDVAARRGAEYQHAYLEYTERKSDAEAVVAELRERGLVGGGRPAPPRPSTSCFTVEQSAQHLRVTANGHVRYPERHRTVLAVALRAGIAGLNIGRDQLLRATFRGAKPTSKTDVENLVLLNIGVRSESLRGGFAFEHGPADPVDTVGYEYEPVPSHDAFRLWAAGRRLIAWPAQRLEYLTAPASGGASAAPDAQRVRLARTRR